MYIRDAFHSSRADPISHFGVTYEAGVDVKSHIAEKPEEQAEVRCNDTLNSYSALLLIRSLE